MKKTTKNDAFKNDILELKKVIKQHKEEIYQLKAIIDELPGDVYWKVCTNKKLVYSGMNRTGISSLQKMGFKWEKDDILGKSDDSLFDKKTSELFIKNDLEVIRSGIARTKEETAILPSGKKIIQLSTKRPLLDKKGNTIGIAGVSIDISELKEVQAALQIALERAKASDKTKTEFLENMRHDIRTPLTGIIGCAQLLRLTTNPKKIADYTNDLIESSNALLNFLNNILEGIQVATGEIPLVKKKFDLRKQIEEIINLNKSLAADKKLKLNLNYDKTIPLYLIGDPVRVQRIVLELLSNALTFTKVGQVTVNIELKKKELREIVLEISVSDTGIGIPKDKQDEIFLRFKRLTSSFQGIYKGLGLGLTTVKQFIDDLGGEIYVKSELDQGAKFTCFIPFQEPLVLDETGLEEIPFPDKNKSFKNQAETPLHHISHAAYKSRILIVEDNLLAAKAAARVFSEFDCNIDIAPDGKAAMKLLRKNVYQLILMDIGLPDTDGIGFTHRIRLNQWQKNHATVPIIGLTAHIGERKQECLDAGMNAVITKPLKIETVQELLATFVQSAPSDSFISSTFPAIKGTVIDFDEIKKTLQDDEEIEECRQLMITGLGEDLLKLEDWYQTKDWESIQSIAHKWQGCAVYYGAKRLELACKNFKNYWSSGQRESMMLKTLYDQLVQEMEAVKEVCSHNQ